MLASGYDRVRGGNLHLANNVRDQGRPHPGLYLRAALPDRGDGSAIVGHHDRWGLQDNEPTRSWNASHPSRGCSQDNLKAS